MSENITTTPTPAPQRKKRQTTRDAVSRKNVEPRDNVNNILKAMNSIGSEFKQMVKPSPQSDEALKRKLDKIRASVARGVTVQDKQREEISLLSKFERGKTVASVGRSIHGLFTSGADLMKDFAEGLKGKPSRAEQKLMQNK